MLRRRSRTVAGLAVGLPLLLGACASALEREPVQTYSLRPADGAARDIAVSQPAGEGAAVAVELPIASGAVAGDRIVVEVNDQIQFVSGARWEDDLPTLLSAKISRALLATEGVVVVDAAQRAGRAGFSLVTAIERMQVRLESDLSGQAVTEIVARLVRLPDREVVATSVFRGQAPVANDAPDTLARAIAQATEQAVADLAAWVAAQTRPASG